MTMLPWNWLKMRVSADKMLWLLTSFRWNVLRHVLEAPGAGIPGDIFVEIWVKNCTARFYNHSIGMINYLIKSNFKFSLQKHHFVYVYEVIIKCYLNFITCFCFRLALIRWNNSHCHLMGLFTTKESCKEKFDSNNNWKTAWPRMILEWHLFLRLSLGFVREILSFVGNHLTFYPKDVCSFSVFFI